MSSLTRLFSINLVLACFEDGLANKFAILWLMTVPAQNLVDYLFSSVFAKYRVFEKMCFFLP